MSDEVYPDPVAGTPRPAGGGDLGGSPLLPAGVRTDAVVAGFGPDEDGGDPGHDVGRELSRYELIERVGAGATGEVWRAFDHRLRRGAYQTPVTTCPTS